VRSRLINRRQKGDLGEASAIEWLTRQGATVSAPLGHSPDYDLIAGLTDGTLVRVQVKTSAFRTSTPDGHERWSVSLRTNGGNQSWTGLAKRFDPTAVDVVYVLVGDGRRWIIPSSAVEGQALALGGPKYSEYEISRTEPIEQLVYGDEGPSLESETPPGEYRSGQTGGAVNAMAQPSQVRILPPPFRSHAQVRVLTSQPALRLSSSSAPESQLHTRSRFRACLSARQGSRSAIGSTQPPMA
jgi:PD-(D/E)XK endonuclease